MAPKKSYVVEKIIDVRLRKGVKEYFLKWENYPEKANTWVKEKNMNCAKLIKKFEKVTFFFQLELYIIFELQYVFFSIQD